MALALFYRALAMGAMGLTAALTGLLTALVPVLFSIAHDGLPTPLAPCRPGRRPAATWLITHAPAGKNRGPSHAARRSASGRARRPRLRHSNHPLQAGRRRQRSVDHDRGSARRRDRHAVGACWWPPKAPWRGFWLYGVLAGMLDTLGNLLYIETTRSGRLDVAAMICSLYPAGPSCWPP
jgi:hypothetical protein